MSRSPGCTGRRATNECGRRSARFSTEGPEPRRKEDVDAIHHYCREQGLDVTFPPTGIPWCVREMHLRHSDGHVFRIYQEIAEKKPADEPPVHPNPSEFT